MRVSQVWLLTLSLAVIIVAIFTMSVIERQRDIVNSDALTRQRENQRLQRSIIRLNADHAVTRLNAIKAGIGAIRLSFIETLLMTTELPEIVDLQYSIGDSRRQPSVPDYLRAELHFDLRHAESVLSVIARLDKAASVWPHLLRGCAMQRQEASIGLAVTCFYDVYVWDALS